MYWYWNNMPVFISHSAVVSLIQLPEFSVRQHPRKSWKVKRGRIKLAETLAAIPLFRRAQALHALIGMGSAVLAAALPYPGKATRISRKGQRSTKLAATPLFGPMKVLHTLTGMGSAALVVLCLTRPQVRWREFSARDKEVLNWQPYRYYYYS